MKVTFSHLKEEAEFQIGTEPLDPIQEENLWMLSITKNK